MGTREAGPCLAEGCAFKSETPELFDVDGTKVLCRMTKDSLVKAGAAAELDQVDCPFVVVHGLIPDETDTDFVSARKANIADKLGIVSFSEGGML